MELTFANRRLQKACQSEQGLRRMWGTMGPTVGRRLMELAAFETLADVPANPPFRRHQLSAKRDEQFAVKVDRMHRLVFEVANDPIPRLRDGGIDLKKVTAIRILEVVDYHGE